MFFLISMLPIQLPIPQTENMSWFVQVHWHFRGGSGILWCLWGGKPCLFTNAEHSRNQYSIAICPKQNQYLLQRPITQYHMRVFWDLRLCFHHPGMSFQTFPQEIQCGSSLWFLGMTFTWFERVKSFLVLLMDIKLPWIFWNCSVVWAMKIWLPFQKRNQTIKIVSFYNNNNNKSLKWNLILI